MYLSENSEFYGQLKNEVKTANFQDSSLLLQIFLMHDEHETLCILHLELHCYYYINLLYVLECSVQQMLDDAGINRVKSATKNISVLGPLSRNTHMNQFLFSQSVYG